jgi:PPOX class probable F420-dependent enzyme
VGNIPHIPSVANAKTRTTTARLDIPDSHAEFFAAPNTAVLTTVGKDGLPQSTAVWYLVDDGVLKTSILMSRQKYKNLVGRPKASLFVLDPTNPYRSVEVRADIELTPDPDKSLLPKFAEHYSVPLEALEAAGDDRVIATFKPVRVVTNG